MSTYQYSTVKLYSSAPTGDWELLAGRFLVVDDIEQYLATKTSKTITNFQYQKCELEIAITVDLSQTYAEPLNSSYKYVSIINSDNPSQIYYYFVKKIIWRSKSSVRFELVMDVLNTFKEGTHYDFKDSTRIIREHKNRFMLSPIQFTMVWNAATTVGSLVINDQVKIINVTQDNTVICEARVINCDYDETTIILETTDGISLTALESAINDAVLYNDYINIYKDSSNYIEDNTFEDVSDFESVIYRDIDYIPENICPILQCGNAGGQYIADKNKAILNKDWFLVYRNQNDPDPDDLNNPVECYLMPSSATAINSGDMTSGRLNANNFDNSFYYVCITSASQVVLDDGTNIPYLSGSYIHHIEIYKNANNTLTVTYVRQVATSPFEAQVVHTYTTSFLTLNALPQDYYKSATHISIYDYVHDGIFNNPNGSWDNGDANNFVDSIDLLDRSEAKNIKVIKLPYIPYEFDVVSNKIDVPNSDWNYIDLGTLKVLKLNKLNTKLHNRLMIADNTSSNPLMHLRIGKISTINPSYNDLRREYTYESKLFNSEFYRPTYVYDSFTFVMQLEKCRLEYYINFGTSLHIDFDVTRTINSRFMFTFDSYQLRNASENYANCMPIARNNEEVLYNVPYINYIRTGYNYDVKNKDLSNISTWLNVGGSAFTIGASLMAPSAALKVAGVVAGAVSFAMSAKNAIITTVQNELSIKSTLTQKAHQTASVSGSDDVDLMSIYANNRLKLLYYTPNEVMLNMINNLFFFAGYASNRIGKPTHNNRINFDYLECDAMIQRLKSMSDECLEELINCFKNGVTYIHKVGDRTTNKWDFEQKYENWEKIFNL